MVYHNIHILFALITILSLRTSIKMVLMLYLFYASFMSYFTKSDTLAIVTLLFLCSRCYMLGLRSSPFLLAKVINIIRIK